MNVTLTRRALLVASALAPLVLVGCGGQTSAQEPPTISYGRDVCQRCGMIISEERFAGALVTAGGDAALFDDVGELVLTVQEEGLDNRRAWAHDRGTGAWIDAVSASFVRGDAGATPMGTGVVAFAQRDDADAFTAEHGGSVMTWNEAISTVA
jgi:copper chaperone NosL